MRAIDALTKAALVLDEVRGNINPERGFADELERDVVAALEAVQAALAKGKEAPAGAPAVTDAMVETAIQAFSVESNKRPRERLRDALNAVLAAQPTPAGAPIAWLHEVVEPNGRELSLLSREEKSPWSHWLEAYKARCTIKVTPLYALPQGGQAVGEVYRYGKDSSGTPWHGIRWYDRAVDVPNGTKLYITPQEKT